MAALMQQVGGRALSYLSVQRGRPPASYGSGHSTTKRYARGIESTGYGCPAGVARADPFASLNMGVVNPTSLGGALRRDRVAARSHVLRRASSRVNRHAERGGVCAPARSCAVGGGLPAHNDGWCRWPRWGSGWAAALYRTLRYGAAAQPHLMEAATAQPNVSWTRSASWIPTHQRSPRREVNGLPSTSTSACCSSSSITRAHGSRSRTYACMPSCIPSSRTSSLSPCRKSSRSWSDCNARASVGTTRSMPSGPCLRLISPSCCRRPDRLGMRTRRTSRRSRSSPQHGGAPANGSWCRRPR